MTPRRFPRHRLTKRLRQITILPHAAFGMAASEASWRLLRSSRQSPSLCLVSRLRRRKQASQLAPTAPFVPVPLPQELSAFAA